MRRVGDWFNDAGVQGTLDVAALLDSRAFDGLCELVQTGALVSLSATRDGGALGLTVTVDGRWRREYFRNGEELVGWLAEAIPAVAQAVEAASASAAPRQRRRGL